VPVMRQPEAVKTWHLAMSRWHSLWMWKRYLCNIYTSVNLLSEINLCFFS